MNQFEGVIPEVWLALGCFAFALMIVLLHLLAVLWVTRGSRDEAMYEEVFRLRRRHCTLRQSAHVCALILVGAAIVSSAIGGSLFLMATLAAAALEVGVHFALKKTPADGPPGI